MNSRVKQKAEADKSLAAKASTGNTNGPFQRQTLKMIQPSVTGCLVGRANEQVQTSIKGKLRSEQSISKVCKPASAMVSEHRNAKGVVQASDLMVKGNPSSVYWKELAEERRKALYEVLQENEKLHKEIEFKDSEIARLKEENEELAQLASHVQYMATMIEQLTEQAPESLETLKDLDLEEIVYEDEGPSSEEDLDSDSEQECSQISSTKSVADLRPCETSNP
ncbi:geminin isoform X2 [Eublepharis macularius]|uniref:Geminin isoform X2 n=1 Tax=Eublepharis macularius TaxID=481883 RepID=A0AA97L418_EUBMA|nr:geminin isoform X2 [Eublepharis macularius]XP_054841235.1 geminin isoform X2 [Eublepharis macularius]XP_054841236.1 geminin isoform X2 [Eublepharis macularius]